MIVLFFVTYSKTFSKCKFFDHVNLLFCVKNLALDLLLSHISDLELSMISRIHSSRRVLVALHSKSLTARGKAVSISLQDTKVTSSYEHPHPPQTNLSLSVLVSPSLVHFFSTLSAQPSLMSLLFLTLVLFFFFFLFSFSFLARAFKAKVHVPASDRRGKRVKN